MRRGAGHGGRTRGCVARPAAWRPAPAESARRRERIGGRHRQSHPHEVSAHQQRLKGNSSVAFQFLPDSTALGTVAGGCAGIPNNLVRVGLACIATEAGLNC